MKKYTLIILTTTIVMLVACSNDKLTYYNNFASIANDIQAPKNAFTKEASKGGQADSALLKKTIDSLVPTLITAIKNLKALESPTDAKLMQQNAIAVDSMLLVSVQAVGTALTANLNDKDAAIFNAKMESNTADMLKMQALLDANVEKFRKENNIIIESKN